MWVGKKKKFSHRYFLENNLIIDQSEKKLFASIVLDEILCKYLKYEGVILNNNNSWFKCFLYFEKQKYFSRATYLFYFCFSSKACGNFEVVIGEQVSFVFYQTRIKTIDS